MFGLSKEMKAVYVEMKKEASEYKSNVKAAKKKERQRIKERKATKKAFEMFDAMYAKAAKDAIKAAIYVEGVIDKIDRAALKYSILGEV